MNSKAQHLGRPDPNGDETVACGSLAALAVPRPRRIAAVISTKLISGPGRQLVSLAGALKSGGVEFEIVCPHRIGSGPDRFAEFVKDHGIACHTMVDRGPFDPLLIREVRAFIARWGPDIVQTHGYKATSIIFALRLLGAKCPWVGFFEGETNKDRRDRLYTAVDLRMLRMADRIVVMSQLQRAYFPASSSYVRVVHNAVPDLSCGTRDFALPGVLLRDRNEGMPVIGVIGRLSHEKGVDVFLDSMSLLRARGVRVTGVIIGEGNDESALKSQAAALELGERVVFSGFLEDVASIYNALDLLVIPSRSEGLPSVLLEAMNADLPVVSTAVGAIIEIAAKYPDAIYLVRPERADQLADGIALALDRLGSPSARAARAAVANDYSIARRAETVLSLYRGILRERGAC